jgi:hypothetical protein
VGLEVNERGGRTSIHFSDLDTWKEYRKRDRERERARERAKEKEKEERERERERENERERERSVKLTNDNKFIAI